jgi:hypothetical protein
MRVRFTFEFTKHEREAIAREGGIYGVATPSDCRKWAMSLLQMELEEIVARMYQDRELAKEDSNVHQL